MPESILCSVFASKKFLYELTWTSIKSGMLSIFSNLPKLFLTFFLSVKDNNIVY